MVLLDYAELSLPAFSRALFYPSGSKLSTGWFDYFRDPKHVHRLQFLPSSN